MFRSDLLQGKRILVTGGGTGLGKSIGRRYLELGAQLIICGRRAEVLSAAADELRSATSGSVATVQCDVRNADSVEAMMEEIWRQGPLDVLVNNAAANFVARTDKLSPRAIDAVLGIVLHGSFYCTVACGRRWIEGQRGGSVISVATTPSFTGLAFTAPSAAAKAGIVAMTRSLAVEWGPKGIRLNAVAPGLFPTEGAWERLYPPGSQVEPQEMGVPLRRVGRHDELANLFAYLAADESAYITGDLIVIDGGRWMQGVGGPSNRAMHDWTEEQWAALRKR
jgi:NAD(P)-dependent dehydrogenase (short-subunit alcohol dehydrogenase family)